MSTTKSPEAVVATTELEAKTEPEFRRLLEMNSRFTFTPMGESDSITIAPATVHRFLKAKTKSGAPAPDEVVMQFCMTCKARKLNPWTGEAYLVGYDGKNGPEWSVITSIAALFKRAEANPNYDGMQSGVVVMSEGKPIEREGDLIYEGEVLVGGWAVVYRKDQKYPSREIVGLKAFDKGFGLWSGAMKPSMISKCAEAGALRKAFPTEIGGMYLEGEFGPDAGRRETAEKPAETPAARLATIIATARPPAAATPPAASPVADKPPPPLNATNSTLAMLSAALRAAGDHADAVDAAWSDFETHGLPGLVAEFGKPAVDAAVKEVVSSLK